MSSIALVGSKPVAWSGGTANVTLRGVQPGNNLSVQVDGKDTAVEPQWGNNTVTVLVPAGDAGNATMRQVKIDLGGGNAYTVNVTVLPDAHGPSFAEDPVWLAMFDENTGGGGTDTNSNATAATQGWNATGWSFETLESILAAHGTGGKQRFTRASGNIAAAIGEGTHTLTSPPVSLDNGMELRFASHYNNTGAPEGQRAAVSISYGGNGGNATEVAVEPVEGALVRIPLSPPNNSSSATFTFTLSGGSNNSYWLIDDIEVVRPLSAEPEGSPLEVIDIISDVQGLEQNAWMRDSLLPGLAKLGNASTLVFNGDIVEWDDNTTYTNFTTAFNQSGAWEHYNNNVIFTAGNHEMYLWQYNSATHIDHYLNWTGMEKRYGEHGRGLWGESVTAAGTPILWLGSEYFDFNKTTGYPPFVNISDTQYMFLAERLAHWREQRRPVLLFSHHPLPYSVSSTWDDFDQTSFGADELRVRYLLAANPHALFVTSHTHYDIAAADQNVNHRPLPGRNSTVTTFNTGATLNYFGIGPKDYEAGKLGDRAPTGLKAEIYQDRIRVKAYRFWNLTTEGTLIQTRDVPNPLGGKIEPSKPGDKPGGKPGSGADAVRCAWALLLAGALAALVTV